MEHYDSQRVIPLRWPWTAPSLTDLSTWTYLPLAGIGLTLTRMFLESEWLMEHFKTHIHSTSVDALLTLQPQTFRVQGTFLPRPRTLLILSCRLYWNICCLNTLEHYLCPSWYPTVSDAKSWPRTRWMFSLVTKCSLSQGLICKSSHVQLFCHWNISRLSQNVTFVT